LFAAGLGWSVVSARPSAAADAPAATDWVTLSKEASAAKSAGRLNEASALYARALRLNPDNEMLLRDSCRVELALERGGASKATSRNACRNALRNGGSAEDLRNEVASLMSPPRRPSLDELVMASAMAEAATKKASDEPWGYLARCDIARRLGSADVMEACLSDLKSHQPLVSTPETVAQRSAALAMAGAPVSLRWRILMGLLLLVAVGTLVHAWIGRQRRGGYPRPAASEVVAGAILVLCALSAAFGGVARAATPGTDQDSSGAELLSGAPKADSADGKTPGRPVKRNLSNFTINDDDPVASVPDAKTLAKGPLQYGYLIQDLAGKADEAVRHGDHAAAARYYAALSKVAPSSAYAPRKLCDQLEAAGDVAKALMACRTAIALQGSTAQDFVHFVSLALNQRRELSGAERKELEAVVSHVAADPASGPVGPMLRCEVALKFEDTKTLEACTADLAKLAPADPRTITFQWALAVQKQQNAVALQFIEKARKAGLNTASVASMERATHKMWMRRIGGIVVIVLGAGVLGFLLAFALRRLGSRRQVSV
jgi:hypothetical protein